MADIDVIRTPGNRSDVFILIDAPPSVYTARAAGAVNKNGWRLGFSGGSGTLTDCLADMPILVGSSAGAADKGVLRIRKDASGGDTQFYVGADPAVVVAANDYLTVLNDFPLWAKHPVGVLMDVDVAYSDQFSSFRPTPWMNGRVRVIRAGETTGFDGSGSWALGSSISGYAWTFSGASSTTGTNTATPTATYEVSGRYRVKLVATAANGKTATAWGWVYVLGPNLAAEADALVDNIDLTYDAGGRARVTMLDRPTIRDGARAILFSDDWYQDTRQSFGPAAYAENILLAGQIIGETIQRTPATNRVEFDVAGPIEVMSSLACLPAGLVDAAFPTDEGVTLPAWSKVSGLTAAKGLHYLIHHRSNLAKVADVRVEDFGWAVPKLSGAAENLLGQLNDFGGRAALAVSADRLGRIFIERDSQLLAPASRAATPTVFELIDRDWQDELSIVRRQRGELAMAEVEGSVYSGGQLTPTGGRSPGNMPAHWGDRDDLDEIYTNTQAQMLQLAGLLAGSKNAEIEAITASLAYHNRLVDVAPRQYVTATVDGEALDCIPRRVTFRHDRKSGFIRTELELEPVGEQWPAVAIDYPGEGLPPNDPPPEPPEPPEPPDDPGPPDDPEPSASDAVVATGADVRTTGDLEEASPTWVTEL